jgi:hypothetical protein
MCLMKLLTYTSLVQARSKLGDRAICVFYDVSEGGYQLTALPVDFSWGKVDFSEGFSRRAISTPLRNNPEAVILSAPQDVTHEDGPPVADMQSQLTATWDYPRPIPVQQPNCVECPRGIKSADCEHDKPPARDEWGALVDMPGDWN